MSKYCVNVLEIFKNGVGLVFSKDYDISKNIKSKSYIRTLNNKRYYIIIQNQDEHEIQELNDGESRRRRSEIERRRTRRKRKK